MSEESAINQAAQELGALLKTKRTEKNIAIGEVAERLKFSAKQIESLESGDYKGLPEPIFVKGFIKTYARFLGLDTDQITVLLNEAFPSQVTAIVSTSSAAESQNGLNFQDQKKSKSFPKWLPLLVVAAAVVGAVYLWQSKSSEQTRQQEKSTLEVGDVAQPQLATDNVQVVPMNASATSASTPVNASAPMAASAAASGGIQIKVRYRSNLIVTDADGTPLHSGIVASNSSHEFKGKAPYQVRIGYATGSEISFNGQPIDLKNHFVDGKTVALTVPQP